MTVPTALQSAAIASSPSNDGRSVRTTVAVAWTTGSVSVSGSITSPTGTVATST
ncbi:MAG: hypothetical protein HZB39_02115 [Planctomycetes bacterium]|nr:hypothetical protein [Planctomycetota bacterium]